MVAGEIDLNAIKRGLVVAPAGCGKTQLITDALARHDGAKPVLVLTHTNAGVAALRGRLEKAGVKPSSYRAATLDGFAIRLISTFPQRAGHNPRIIDGARPNYEAIRDAAARLVAAGHVHDILAASYERLFVDEYQDCSIRQHALVTWLAQSLPTAIVGDPFQSIFGFGGDPLADWNSEVLTFFPVVGELTIPWRWNNAGAAELGNWLLSLRPLLASGTPIDLRTAPAAVQWIELDGRRDDALRLEAAAVQVPGEAKVLIIGDSIDPRGQRRFARQVDGAVTVEAVDLRDLTDFGAALDLSDPGALAVAAGFAENLMSNFSADDLVRSITAARAGSLSRALSDLEQAAVVFEQERTLSALADLLVSINRAGGVRCYRPAVLAAAQRALQLAASPGGPSFREATVAIREQTRLVGRPLARRSVGSTLLLKGLEADVSVVLNAAALNARNLYVAMTRGSSRVIVCSSSPMLNPVW
ncbi:UvrD-helicase domain-containing protein [Rhizobium binae]|uniref:DNA 3'-5' helicase II n=1 Tax=Rhizobium binae TaxID=1138190 RepID=A0ABV2MPB7_9HYPH|nr:UvrD-helicase domain-containing protein [Rhizobium binae]NKL51927.1 AAA family ATPase [Rhizobium leguminosarum bv. viciae]MBX4938028.1 UvrD-helicase domain-containing protein [Rhizobium binae]MBX4944392.1 UvrD-helicase domain-containing protein [Rhizobium binae]MBX4980490.1 UvrD-helicase domain-containing protein [Rhizobium binae]MBX4995668.1 UvrD-helicase domain-containing protein [Rhizobium binae]